MTKKSPDHTLYFCSTSNPETLLSIRLVKHAGPGWTTRFTQSRYIALLCAVALTLVQTTYASSESTLRVNADGTALVKGYVLENNLGCTRDLACYLRLRRSQEDVWVIYHGGEDTTTCLNEVAMRTGLTVRVGMQVTALGMYRRDKKLHVVDLCALPTSYLITAKSE